MKILSLVVTIGGIIALVLAIIDVLASTRIMGVTGAGFVRGSMSLFLLALVIMAYDRFYLQKK